MPRTTSRKRTRISSSTTCNASRSLRRRPVRKRGTQRKTRTNRSIRMPFRKRHSRGGNQIKIKKQIYHATNDTNDLKTLNETDKESDGVILLNEGYVGHKYRVGDEVMNIDEIENPEKKKTSEMILKFIDTVWSDIDANITHNKNVKYTLSHNSNDYIIVVIDSKKTVTLNYDVYYDIPIVKFINNQSVSYPDTQSNASSIDRNESTISLPENYPQRMLNISRNPHPQ